MSEPWADPDHRSDSPKDAAASALELIPELADSTEPLDPGQLKLGEGFRSCFIGRDELRQEVPNPDFRALLSKGSVVTYPVKQGDRIVSSVTVAQKPAGGWGLESVGSVNQVRAIAEIRDSDVAETGRDPGDYFLVSIPALKVFLVGTAAGEGVIVSSVFNNAILGFQAGVWAPAEEVLAAAARRVNHQDEDEGM